MGYLFDTNIFITAKNQLPADVWPTFWLRMSELILDKKVFTSTKVREEIERGNDELTLWMTQNRVPGFYIELDSEILTQYAETLNWAKGLSLDHKSRRQLLLV